MKTVSFGRQDPFEHKCRGSEHRLCAARRNVFAKAAVNWKHVAQHRTGRHTHTREIKTQLALRPSDHPLRHEFASDVLERPDKHKYIPKTYGILWRGYVQCLRAVNGRNVKISGSESLHVLLVQLDPACRRTLPVSISALCHSRIDGPLGNVLWYSAQKLPWVGKCDLFSANHAAHWAFAWGVDIVSFLCNK